MSERDDLWDRMAPALAQDLGFVLATVVSTSSSTPRPAGTQMSILDDGTVIGSLSGGCIEADVYAHAQEVAATGRCLTRDYGFSDGEALDVGLTCGGSLRVFLERVAPEDLGHFRALTAAVGAGEAVATVTAVAGPDSGWRGLVAGRGDGREGGPAAGASGDARVARAAALLEESRSGVVTLPGADGGAPSDYFVRSFTAPARMVVFGSNAYAAALARLATVVGYHVTVCDARHAFTTRERFPEADEIVVQWPHEYLATHRVDHRTVLCALTHDPKFDDPLLERALRSPAAFVGAMGSRRTSEERIVRLRDRGLGEAELARLHAPFGLDLGAGTPEETAVSMLAEVISSRQGGSNLPLHLTRGPVHEAAHGRGPASVEAICESPHSNGPRTPKPRTIVPATRQPTQ